MLKDFLKKIIYTIYNLEIMKKECFTCKNKESKELTETEIKKINADNIANNKPYDRIPELIFTCKATGNRIKQTDPACGKYNPDDFI
jgi:hypothetical protein